MNTTFLTATGILVVGIILGTLWLPGRGQTATAISPGADLDGTAHRNP